MQRVSRAAVHVDREVVGEIRTGLVVFAGVTAADSERDADFLSDKIANLRIFEDDAGKFNRSVGDIGGEILVVSQFTLYANTRRGRRPDFIEAARPEVAEPLIERLVDQFRARGLAVATGRFKARMLVEISNEGPVTIWIDSKDRAASS